MSRKNLSLTFCILFSLCLSLVCISSTSAEQSEPEITEASSAISSFEPMPINGKVYTFDKNNNYEFSTATVYSSSDSVTTYGSFSISGIESPITLNGQKDGVPSITMPSGNIAIKYEYDDTALSANDYNWHVIDDNISTVDVLKLDKNVQKGAIILQKSMDHLNWYNISTMTNAFINTPVQNGSLYETQDVEMINGCFYRLLVVYEETRKTGTSNFLGIIPTDEYEFKRTAEVHEFYAILENDHIEELTNNTTRYSLGNTTLAADFAGYKGDENIGKGDLHYGWDLGNFFVSGFTNNVNVNGKTIFLKNVGDVVTLWFNLKQNINALNNDGSLTITADPDGYDLKFQTGMMNFGRGMLIIRYTDSENVKHDPVMYYDYLPANTTFGTNTRVQLFEEGDYEVALDYEVTKAQLIPQTHHYYIAFNFSVRNANCMVYPFDVKTGAELTNSSVTENGFYLDLAKSRYLNIFIKKEVWTEGADGLVEDTRFNTASKDGAKYTDEGIYTITARNQYTGLETTKKIYVGTNRILAAYVNSGYSLKQIQQFVDNGAIIYEDGTIKMPEKTKEPVESIELVKEESTTDIIADGKDFDVIPETEQNPLENVTKEMPEETPQQEASNPSIIIIIAVVCSIIITLLLLRKKQKNSRTNEVEKND